jgi:pyridoxine 5'-phosphate synthase PdxJ
VGSNAKKKGMEGIDVEQIPLPMTPEKAQKILREGGLDLPIEKVKLVLEFLNNLANIAVSVYLDDQEY